ncbi:MAG: tRNA pseudouridine synthase B [Thermotoga sp. 50_1627]|nr:MAG: tRNA pseudouridine synthase B [Thermotoga sp. 50_64]KUK25986.1 MAG: tRNA pseudouridine synthase B [Thermotoga sp. 50_1627]MDK2922675.1 tRNA pseudouridine55 synthase [Pseudothermotoga sp.]
MSISGILLVDKPRGPTSHDVVEEVRKKLNQRRVGHAGTLDPFATGLLIIGVGNATRLLEYLMNHNKVYRVKMKLGLITDTFDTTGKIEEERQCNATKEEIIETIKSFVGSYVQVPPAYSAKKYKGERLYELARQGKIVRLPPRQVTIYCIEDIEVEDLFVSFTVETSPGTYVRSLCMDIGYKLGCGATAVELRRLSIGPFNVEDAVDVYSLSAEEITKRIIPISRVLHFPKVWINNEAKKRVLNGMKIHVKDILNHEPFEKGSIVQVFNEDVLLCLARAERRSTFLKTLLQQERNEAVLKPFKVFKES